jgi:hypothetical protein
MRQKYLETIKNEEEEAPAFAYSSKPRRFSTYYHVSCINNPS